jgi:DNA replication protein DnaC
MIMLRHPTLDKLHALKLCGMAAAFTDQSLTPESEQMSFEERLGLLVDREMTERENRRMTSRLRRAKLRHSASLEDIDYRSPRGLDQGLIQSLGSCQWIKEHLNLLITGPTGVGKTWLACALAHKACREGYTVQYVRLNRLLQELCVAKGDGRYPRILANLSKVDVLLLDDWGLVKMTAENRRDLLEVMEDRQGRRSTIATSQLPIEEWHGVIGDATLADAILDRLVHNAYKINLRGESMRKKRKMLTENPPSE